MICVNPSLFLLRKPKRGGIVIDNLFKRSISVAISMLYSQLEL